MEPDQIDVLALTVFRDLQKIEDAKETGFARQTRSDIRETDPFDRIHFDLALVHTVPSTDFDMGTRPYPDAAGDFSATNSLPQAPGESHDKSLARQIS